MCPSRGGLFPGRVAEGAPPPQRAELIPAWGSAGTRPPRLNSGIANEAEAPPPPSS